jgi:hypothetical protein
MSRDMTGEPAHKGNDDRSDDDCMVGERLRAALALVEAPPTNLDRVVARARRRRAWRLTAALAVAAVLLGAAVSVARLAPGPRPPAGHRLPGLPYRISAEHAPFTDSLDPPAGAVLVVAEAGGLRLVATQVKSGNVCFGFADSALGGGASCGPPGGRTLDMDVRHGPRGDVLFGAAPAGTVTVRVEAPGGTRLDLPAYDAGPAFGHAYFLSPPRPGLVERRAYLTISALAAGGRVLAQQAAFRTGTPPPTTWVSSEWGPLQPEHSGLLGPPVVLAQGRDIAGRPYRFGAAECQTKGKFCVFMQRPNGQAADYYLVYLGDRGGLRLQSLTTGVPPTWWLVGWVTPQAATVRVTYPGAAPIVVPTVGDARFPVRFYVAFLPKAGIDARNNGKLRLDGLDAHGRVVVSFPPYP